jgi:hypothetical protein
MTTPIYIHLSNGLGDRLLDIVGFSIICKYLNYSPHLQINKAVSHWNAYDERLIVFNEIGNEECTYHMRASASSASSSPYMVYSFIRQYIPDLTFAEITDAYSVLAKQTISPANMILERIPAGIENAHGIHLRKSDKVAEYRCSHVCTLSEFEIITSEILKAVAEIIRNEENPTFLVVSEDAAWKSEFQQKIRDLAAKPVQILDPDYSESDDYANFASILDLFCLSRCKSIHQGAKYSSFSMIAALLGSGKFVNYSQFLPLHHESLFHIWRPVFDAENIDEAESAKWARDFSVGPIETNIAGPCTP